MEEDAFRHMIEPNFRFNLSTSQKRSWRLEHNQRKYVTYNLTLRLDMHAQSWRTKFTKA